METVSYKSRTCQKCYKLVDKCLTVSNSPMPPSSSSSSEESKALFLGLCRPPPPLEEEGFFEPEEEEELLLVFLVDFLTLSSSAESSVSSPSLESGWISDFLLALALPELENLVELDFCLRLLFLAGDFSSASGRQEKGKEMMSV